MQSPQQNQSGTEQIEGEISLLDIISFLEDAWKKLAIAAIAGAILGFASWNFLGSYQAEYVLHNNNNNNNNNYALDLVSWKTIQKSLPSLAAQIEDEGRTPESQAGLYKTLASEQWWQKNVVPSYALSKADAKDLAIISKDLDLASTTILSLTVKAGGSTKDKSIENVRAAAKFLLTGSAYLQLRSLINSYETETISTVADLQKKITTTEIEMGYQAQRAKSLENLYKRFPGRDGASNQVVDPKDSGAKYLPLATQIIAVNNDIDQSKEALKRYKDRLMQIAQLKIFLEEAIPMTDKTFDGIVLGDELLAIEAKLRSKISKDDIKQQEIFDQIRIQLLFVKSRFTKSLEANTAPTSSKKGMIKTTASGVAGAFFLMLLVLLGQRVWRSIKNGGAALKMVAQH
jgi:hypothetical protein